MFFDFYDVNMSTKSKTDREVSRISFDRFFLKLCGVVTSYFSYKVPYFCENLSELMIYRKMTNYRILEKPSEQPSLFTIQNVRQYRFHDVAKNEKNSPKESVDIKEFR